MHVNNLKHIWDVMSVLWYTVESQLEIGLAFVLCYLEIVGIRKKKKREMLQDANDMVRTFGRTDEISCKSHRLM